MTRGVFFHILPSGPAYAGVPGSTAVIVDLPPGFDPIGMHRHHHVDELIVVLAGEIAYREEGDAAWHRLRPGQSHFFGRGLAHHVMSRSADSARVLFVLSPGHIPGLCFAELQQALQVSNPPDREWIADIMRRYETEIIPDPAMPDPAAPGLATPDPATPGLAMPDPATPDPATPDPAPAGPDMPAPDVTGPADSRDGWRLEQPV